MRLYLNGMHLSSRAMWEAEIGSIAVPDKPGHKSLRDPSQQIKCRHGGEKLLYQIIGDG
jgi:hypothetical protein